MDAVNSDLLVTHSFPSKATELINTTPLNGMTFKFPLTVYGLFTNNALIDINSHHQCQCTTNTTQFKVTQDCDYVYFDGTELVDDRKTQIQIKYKQKTEFLELTVYQPELPLQLESELDELVDIKDWYVPNLNEQYGTLNDLKYYLNTIGDYELHDDYDFEDPLDELLKIFCKLQQQTTRITVLTKFYYVNGHGLKDYLISDDERKPNEPLVFDVSSQVRLKADNPKYANINSNKILSPISHGPVIVQVRNLICQVLPNAIHTVYIYFFNRIRRFHQT
jgi:hypothetical protein